MCASLLPTMELAISLSYLIGDFKNQRTTVSVTKGVGVQPRGGVRLNEGAEMEKHRETGTGRRILVDVRGIDPNRRWTEGVGRISMDWLGE